jgi:hypothetical protein
MKRSATVSRLAMAAALGTALALSVASGSFAANPTGTGQPGAECGDPGAELAPHGFSSPGFAGAELVYAGSDGAHSLISGNVHAKSQYDVACFQFTSSH